MPTLLVVSTTAYFPDCSGGAELSTHTLLAGLMARGWRVEVLCRHAPRDPLLRQACVQELGRQGKPSRVIRDNSLGYTCSRVLVLGDGASEWDRHLRSVLEKLEPDLVLNFQDPGCPLLSQAVREGYPGLYFAHNLAAVEHGVPIPGRLHLVANSPYTASRMREYTGRAIGVVLEMIDPALYTVRRREPAYITMINPIPEKGLGVALDVARALPHERFLFVKGKWVNMSDELMGALLEPARELSNIEIRDHQEDMRTVYAETDILLVPSQFTETFGRVIVEAHLNGIPVVASDVGGISFALGDGGLLVRPRGDARAFVDAILRLRRERGLHSRLSQAALANSRRPELDTDLQIANFIQATSRWAGREEKDQVQAAAPGGRSASQDAEESR